MLKLTELLLFSQRSGGTSSGQCVPVITSSQSAHAKSSCSTVDNIRLRQSNGNLTYQLLLVIRLLIYHHFLYRCSAVNKRCIYQLLSWFIIPPRSSHLPNGIFNTLIIHHPIIVLCQAQNVSFSQIVFSIDTWHPFGLILQISGLSYNFFLRLFFFEFWLSLRYVLFLSQASYLSHERLFLDFFFYRFSSI